MDESKAIAQVIAAYEKLLRQSPRIQSLEKKLADGTITMKEGAELNDLRAKAFGRAFSGSVLGIERGSREGACVDLLKDRCADVDELARAAQRADLARQGLNLTPPTAPFEEDRARKIGHSLEDTTVPDETIQRRARSATENMLNSQYDRDMKKGAETCASAGLKTYIVRDSGSGCCKWCDEVSGRFAYGTEPKDVYRRHDNCTCTVVYESSRGKQNVWSKQYWSKEQEQKYLELRDELKAKKMTAAPDVKKPVRLSEKEVQAIINKVGGLTYKEKSGILPLAADRMGQPMKESIPGKSEVKVYKRDGYDNIWTQTNTINAQLSAAYISNKIKNGDYGNVDRVIVVKNSVLGGIAAYYQGTNTLYWSEELMEPALLAELVSTDHFAAKTIDEIIDHELGGHKRHWDKVKELYNSDPTKYEDLLSAKQALETELRDYIRQQIVSDAKYIKRYVSENADENFYDSSSLNELIADEWVLSKNQRLQDEILDSIVRRILGYEK